MIVQRITITPKSGQMAAYLEWVKKHAGQWPKVTHRWYNPISGRNDVVVFEMEFADWAAREKWFKDWGAYWAHTLPPEERIDFIDHYSNEFYQILELG